MEIEIECYGVTGRLAGGPGQRVDVVPGTRVSEVLALLAVANPALAAVLPGCACAIGDAIVPRTRVLAGGERLALLPPVSGG